MCVVYLHKSGSHVTESGSHLSFQHFCSAVFCRNLAPDESFEDEIRVAIRHTAAAFLACSYTFSLLCLATASLMELIKLKRTTTRKKSSDPKLFVEGCNCFDVLPVHRQPTFPLVQE